MTPEAILDARYHAHALAESATAAYWLKSRDDVAAQMLIRDAHQSFATLAEAMGYAITPIAQEVAA